MIHIYAGNSYIHFSPHMILTTDMIVQGYVLFRMSDVIATLTLTLIVHSSDSSVFALQPCPYREGQGYIAILWRY